MILEKFCSGPIDTNSYLLGCNQAKVAVLIDAPFDSVHHWKRRSEELGLKVEKLLLTHSHWDHSAESALASELFGLEVWVQEEDLGNVVRPGSDKLPMLEKIRPVEKAQLLFDGQKLFVGKLELEVLHTPGHSGGSVCFYIPSEKALISGDTLFRGTMGNVSFPTSSPKRMWKSLKRLATLPAETRVFPGHGEETMIGKESWIVDAEKKYY